MKPLSVFCYCNSHSQKATCFRQSSGFRPCTVVYRNGYSLSDRKNLCTVLLLEVISRVIVRVLTSGVSSTLCSIASTCATVRPLRGLPLS
ncbi:hypothetical protein TNCT_628731 [Trichonephila clavata]|uniref:Uncharacterized protein n=1 Tax=Trichonephila clavata TaxID=2740835 RepID=A0A8X6G8V0_TRICU|nr:hypothetical protein TNCT_628731 [Trichonephila clavata]